jgi:fumarate reductase subunit C
MNERTLYHIQRGSALVLAPLVLIHIVVILYAIRGGLSGAEILGRTRGSVLWASYYGLFVAIAALHAPIGLRNILREWTAWRGSSLDLAMVLFGLLLLVVGMRAVVAVIA